MTINLETARENLVRSLRYEVQDERVLAAMPRVPREHFLPLELRPYAYEDRPLPIGHGQTISQPLMVAIMTAALSLQGDERVLEVGTGPGDQLAAGGRLAIPVGDRRLQQLLLVTRAETGLEVRRLGECRFVPLVGRGAW